MIPSKQVKCQSCPNYVGSLLPWSKTKLGQALAPLDSQGCPASWTCWRREPPTLGPRSTSRTRRWRRLGCWCWSPRSALHWWWSHEKKGSKNILSLKHLRADFNSISLTCIHDPSKLCLLQAQGHGSALLRVHSLTLALSHGAAVLAGKNLGY